MKIFKKIVCCFGLFVLIAIASLNMSLRSSNNIALISLANVEALAQEYLDGYSKVVCHKYTHEDENGDVKILISIDCTGKGPETCACSDNA